MLFVTLIVVIIKFSAFVLCLTVAKLGYYSQALTSVVQGKIIYYTNYVKDREVALEKKTVQYMKLTEYGQRIIKKV
jgi:hypothetical protein